jgi:sn-glycerol 3-phosphate transport system substrate-binding protein
VAHIDRIQDMVEEGLFVYGGRRGDSRPQFVNGEAAMWINSSAYFGGFEADIQDFEFTQVPMPIDTSFGRAAELDHRRRHALGAARP